MSRCAYCQIDPSLRCPGEDVRRFCELVDPAHHDFQPAYHRTLRAIAEGTAGGPFVPAAAAEIVTDGTPCCGDNVSSLPVDYQG